jgi:hypothetical protein
MIAQAAKAALATVPASRQIGVLETPQGRIPRIVDEFWTAKQRQMHSLHYSLSYRASFKPELPDFFIRRFTEPGQVVADPFGGRGTTLLQATLLGRRCWQNDANPLSERIAYPKTNPVSVEQVERRLQDLDLDAHVDLDKEEDMSMFYHPNTYRELLNLRRWLKSHRSDEDRFIEMLALSRLHGHSPGFFSAYSFPQISIPKANQIKINKTRGAEPEYRDIRSRLIKKARSALKDGEVDQLRQRARGNILTTGDSRNLAGWPSESVNLVVTSPPFLNQVDYVQDTWIEAWFCDIPTAALQERIVQTPDLEEWMGFISETLRELHRVVVPGGLVAMEVGEVRYQGELLNLDETVVSLTNSPRFNAHQFRVREIYVQSQEFTKLANCFKVKNNVLGTNSNRIVLMEKI